jgi:hypothetical protein
MAEYQRSAEEFGRRMGLGFTPGSKDFRKIVNEIAKSGQVDVSEGSLKTGLQEIDRVAEIARRH